MMDVLVIERRPGEYVANPFLKEAMDGIYYQGIELIVYTETDRKEAEDILHNCGYFYIRNVISVKDLGQKKCGWKFFQQMISEYHKDATPYGLIDDRMNLFAKRNHLDFLLYTPPVKYPGRICVGKNLKEEEKILDNFINQQLFCGYRKESRGYYFGYGFVGILLYEFIQYVQKEKEQRDIYITCSSWILKEVCREMFPEEKIHVLYADPGTKRDMWLEYVLQGLPLKDAVIVDFSLEENFKEYLEKNTAGRVINCLDFFQKEIVHCGKEVDRIVEMVAPLGVQIQRYDGEKPVWNSTEQDFDRTLNALEVERGIMDFVREYGKGFGRENVKITQEFLKDVLRYAFDEKKRGKKHMEPRQAFFSSRVVKAGFRLVQKAYGLVKRR
jgi:hypothetical protein